MHGNDKDVVASVKLHMGLIHDLLQSLSDSDLVVAPIPGCGTFGKQFRHILDIRGSYRDAVVHGRLDFYREDIDHALENDKARLVAQFRELNDSILEIMESIAGKGQPDTKIDCHATVKYLGPEMSYATPFQILSMMAEHDVFHEGELALYLRTMGIEFPESWKIWGLGR